MIDFEIQTLTDDIDTTKFDCGNADINDFLKDDSIEYQEGLLAVTYIVTEQVTHDIIAYFCLLNDKLAYLSSDDKSAWNRLNRKIRNHKRLKSYPAVKIGRLGTSKKYARQGVARDLLDFIKHMFASSNRTGCRFITVDAHREAIGLYEKCGFTFFSNTDEEDDTRLMYFDLLPYKQILEESKYTL